MTGVLLVVWTENNNVLRTCASANYNFNNFKGLGHPGVVYLL